MFDIIGESLFAALRDAVEHRLGRDHPCFAAVDQAVEETGPAATQAVQAAIAGLDPEIAAALMADAHKSLRENSRVILGAWRDDTKPH